MPFTKFAQVGRVVYLTDGKHKGKLAAIVDIIDTNRALIDGPFHGIPRQAYPLCETRLLPWVIKITRTARTYGVRSAWIKAKINSKFENSQMNQNLINRRIKANMGDFDRYKLGRARQVRNKIVKKATVQLKQEAIEMMKPRNVVRRQKAYKKRQLEKEKAKQFKLKLEKHPNARRHKIRRSAKGHKKTAEVKPKKTTQKPIDAAFTKVKALLAQESEKRAAAIKEGKPAPSKRAVRMAKLVREYHNFKKLRISLGYQVPKSTRIAKQIKLTMAARAHKKTMALQKARAAKNAQRRAARKAKLEKARSTKDSKSKDPAEPKTADSKAPKAKSSAKSAKGPKALTKGAKVTKATKKTRRGVKPSKKAAAK